MNLLPSPIKQNLRLIIGENLSNRAPRNSSQKERNRAPRKFVKHQADGNIRKSSANKSLTSRKESHDVVRTQTPAKSLNLATDVETNVATGVSSSAVGVSPAVTIQKDHATQKQLHNSLAGPSRQNDLVVVDLDSAGFISSGISAKGSDTASASGSESLSNEDYHSPEEVDRFIQVMTRQIRKRSNGKARARGPLNL